MNNNTVSTSAVSRINALARKLWFPFLLLLLTILTYGLLTFRQGFYLDDWYIILFKEKLGNEGFLLYFSKDRPFLSYPYVALMAIFGESAASWAIFALIMRWITTCTFWQLLNKLFPEKKKLWMWAAVLFAVYPGFRFHWFAIMYAFAYIFLTFYFLSFLGMAKALENTARPARYGLWTLLGLVCLLIGIVPQEYFFGMELFRPILLFLLIKRAQSPNRKGTARKTFLHWLPRTSVELQMETPMVMSPVLAAAEVLPLAAGDSVVADFPQAASVKSMASARASAMIFFAFMFQSIPLKKFVCFLPVITVTNILSICEVVNSKLYMLRTILHFIAAVMSNGFLREKSA